MNDSGRILDFRRRSKRKRIDVSGAGNDFLDHLTLIGLKNNSTSERTLQIAGTYRGEYRCAHREHQSGARSWHMKTMPLTRLNDPVDGLDRPCRDRRNNCAHADTEQLRTIIPG